MKLPTGNTYSVAQWDPSAAVFFITRVNADWGPEAILYKYLSNTNTNLAIREHGTGRIRLYWLISALARLMSGRSHGLTEFYHPSRCNGL